MKDTLRKLLAKGGPFIGLILVIVLFSLPTETREFFLTYHNFKIIFTQTVIVAIGALGMTMIIVSGGIDLSVGSSIAFTSVVGALLIQSGWGPAPVVGGMIVSSALIGLLNGVAIAGLRMTPFIITLGTLGVARGSAKWMAENQTVNYDASPINQWMTTADPAGYGLPPRGVGRPRPGDPDGLGVEKHGVWPACVCPGLQRGDGAAVRYSDRATENHDLRAGRVFLRSGGSVSTFPAPAGRPDGGRGP